LDLNRAITYAAATGELRPSPCRQHLAFIDGIVGGEGQGPLSPRAVQSGLLMFSRNPVLADFACASMMGFDPQRIPMIREALRLPQYPLVEPDWANEQVVYNGQVSSLPELVGLAPYHYTPSIGWQGRL